jgi:hypothetical protein
MENSDLKQYFDQIRKRLNRPVAKWIYFLLFISAFILFILNSMAFFWDFLLHGLSALPDWLIIENPDNLWHLRQLQFLIIFIPFIIFVGLTMGMISEIVRKINNYYSQPENLKVYKGRFFHQLVYKVCQLVYKAFQRIEEPMPAWLFLVIFTSFLIFCISFFFGPGTFWGAIWDGLINVPFTLFDWMLIGLSDVLGFSLNLFSSIWNLPWYVLLGGFIVWFVIANILFIILDFQGTKFTCELCHTELIRRFLYFIETKRISHLDLKRKGDRHSRRALNRINRRRNKFSDDEWKRIINRRKRLLIHLKLLERKKPKIPRVIKYMKNNNLSYYDNLEDILFILSFGIINFFVYMLMQPTCPRCGEENLIETTYGYEG